jgi:hypothetical protein
MPEFPQKIARKRMTSMLDPYIDYLTQRWQTGCRNALQLWREIRQLGYPGTSRHWSSPGELLKVRPSRTSVSSLGVRTAGTPGSYNPKKTSEVRLAWQG